jgi:hypothetical protein
MITRARLTAPASGRRSLALGIDPSPGEHSDIDAPILVREPRGGFELGHVRIAFGTSLR